MSCGISLSSITNGEMSLFMEYMDTFEKFSFHAFEQDLYPSFGGNVLYIPLDDNSDISPVEPEFIDIGPDIGLFHSPKIAPLIGSSNSVDVKSIEFINAHLNNAAGHVPVLTLISSFNPPPLMPMNARAIRISAENIKSEIIKAKSTIIHRKARKWGQFHAFPATSNLKERVIYDLLILISSGTHTDDIFESIIEPIYGKVTYGEFLLTYPVTPKTVLSCLNGFYGTHSENGWMFVGPINTGVIIENKVFGRFFPFSTRLSVHVYEMAARVLNNLNFVISRMISRKMIIRDEDVETRVVSLQCAFILSVYISMSNLVRANCDNIRMIENIKNLHLINTNDAELASQKTLEHMVRSVISFTVNGRNDVIPCLLLFNDKHAEGRRNITAAGRNYSESYPSEISEIFKNINQRGRSKLVEIMTLKSREFCDVVITQHQSYKEYMAEFGLSPSLSSHRGDIHLYELWDISKHGPESLLMVQSVNTVLGLSHRREKTKFSKFDVYRRIFARLSKEIKNHTERETERIISIEDSSITKRGEFKDITIKTCIYTGFTAIGDMHASVNQSEQLFMGWLWTATNSILVESVKNVKPVWVSMKKVDPKQHVFKVNKTCNYVEMELLVPLSNENVGDLLSGIFTPVIGNHLLGWFKGKNIRLVLSRFCIRTQKKFNVEKNTKTSATWDGKYCGYHSAHSAMPYADFREKLLNQTQKYESLRDHVLYVSSGGDQCFVNRFGYSDEKLPDVCPVDLSSIWGNMVETYTNLHSLRSEIKVYNNRVNVKSRAHDEWNSLLTKKTAIMGEGPLFFFSSNYLNPHLPELVIAAWRNFKETNFENTIEFVKTWIKTMEIGKPIDHAKWENVFQIAAGIYGSIKKDSGFYDYKQYVEKIEEGEDSLFMILMMFAYEHLLSESRKGENRVPITDLLRNAIASIKDGRVTNEVNVFVDAFRIYHEKCYRGEVTIEDVLFIYEQLGEILRDLRVNDIDTFISLIKKFDNPTFTFNTVMFERLKNNYVYGEMHIKTQYIYAKEYIDTTNADGFFKAIEIIDRGDISSDSGVPGLDTLERDLFTVKAKRVLKVNTFLRSFKDDIMTKKIDAATILSMMKKGIQIRQLLKFELERALIEPWAELMTDIYFIYEDMIFKKLDGALEFYRYPWEIELSDFI